MKTCLLSIGTHSVEETQKLAYELALELCPQDTILLTGDLGAGKTHFTQGLATGLGVSQEITSPTFNLVVDYQGSHLTLYHFDLYRLNDSSELEDIAYYDLLEAGGVCVIEWADKFPDELPDHFVAFDFEIQPDETRLIRCSASDDEGVETLQRLAKRLSQEDFDVSCTW